MTVFTPATNLPAGWLTPVEADELRKLADGKTVLELGAWKGRSTVVLAETARVVMSVDNHGGIPTMPDIDDSLDDYLATVRDLPNVVIVIADFQTVVPHLGTFDLVFVDGTHDDEPVARDANLALTVDPTVIAFHDWDIRAVSATVSLAYHRKPTRIVDSLAIYAPIKQHRRRVPGR